MRPFYPPRDIVYRSFMRLTHRFDWHHAPVSAPLQPTGERQRWCKWCGLRREVGPGPSNGSLGAVILNGLRGGWIRNIAWTAAGTVRAHKRSIGIYCGTDKARAA